MGFESFGHLDVVESGVEMPSAGGGLHDALAVENLELGHGERVVLVIDAEVMKVRFDRSQPKDEDCTDLRRVHVLRVNNAAVIDRELVAEALAEQRRKVEAAKGNDSLPFGDDLNDEPAYCPHDRPVGECSTCPAPAPAADGEPDDA